MVQDAHPKSLGDIVLGIHLLDRNALSRKAASATLCLVGNHPQWASLLALPLYRRAWRLWHAVDLEDHTHPTQAKYSQINQIRGNLPELQVFAEGKSVCYSLPRMRQTSLRVIDFAYA